MKILVCGARDWENILPIQWRLADFPSTTIVIHGACGGADRLADIAAMRLGFEIMPFPAHWEHSAKCEPGCTRATGPAAGPIRNCAMLDEKPDLVLAFHPDLRKSKGTRDCVAEAKRRGIPVEVYGR